MLNRTITRIATLLRLRPEEDFNSFLEDDIETQAQNLPMILNQENELTNHSTTGNLKLQLDENKPQIIIDLRKNLMAELDT